MVPNEYYEPTLLKEQELEPCLAGAAGRGVPYCRHFVYPDVSSFPTGWADYAERPGGGGGQVYSWEDDPNVLAELGSRKLATMARWQPELEFPVRLIYTYLII